MTTPADDAASLRHHDTSSCGTPGSAESGAESEPESLAAGGPAETGHMVPTGTMTSGLAYTVADCQ